MYRKILLTGATGFVGTNLSEYLYTQGYNICYPDCINNAKHNVIQINSSCDLTNIDEIKTLVDNIRPDCIIHLAAVCGGIGANRKSPGKFMRNNLLMGFNVLEMCLQYECIKKLINVGTICSYPKHAKIPFKEEDIWNGYPEETNAPYGIAKKTITELSIAYHKQYKLNVTNLFPTNMYGPEDVFDPQSSHVIPAIILKVHNAIKNNQDSITLWGSGTATRDFLYVRDFCCAVESAMCYDTDPYPINIGTKNEYSIKTIAEMICDIMKFNGNIIWNTDLPDGQPRRCVDYSRAKSLLRYHPQTSITSGLIYTIEWFNNIKG